ncbi:uncharacterized protein LOC144351801 [Saccoglossus kowalevskii]
MDPANYSNVNRLYRVTAYVLRFINRLKDKSLNYCKFISAEEMNHTETLWVKTVQHETFPELFTPLRKQTKKPQLCQQLVLFLDEHGIIRCGGRIHNADMNFGIKFPVLLPTHSSFTSLIISSEHARSMHGGTQTTVTLIRQRYWIPKIRRVVKQATNKCVICRRVVGKPYADPIAAPLPGYRVQKSNPFEVTGVDFTGALHIKRDNRDTKVYICLFTCAATRAVHLELVPNT